MRPSRLAAAGGRRDRGRRPFPALRPPGAARPLNLYLARHGATEWSRSGRHTGRTDLPLLPEGEANARRLGERLRGTDFSAAYTSPLARARRTAELAGFPDARVTDLLREFDYGGYEGLTYDQIRARRPDWELYRDGCPGGETPAEVFARARRFVELVLGAGGNVIAFAHGHITRAVAVAFIERDIELAARLSNLDTGALGILVDGDRGRVLGGWNRD